MAGDTLLYGPGLLPRYRLASSNNRQCTWLRITWTLHSLFADLLPAPPVPDYLTHGLLFAFCWLTAITLGVSSANLREEHLSNTLHAMQILVTDMREPITTIGAIATKLELSATAGKKLAELQEDSDRLGSRIHEIIRLVHTRLDTHVTNASISHMLRQAERVSAYEVLNEVVARYPFRNARERESVCLIVEADFEFQSSFRHFAQAITNLLNNAFLALEQKGKPLEPGDLSILVSATGNSGFIRVRDFGTGIAPAIVDRVFEPFFSTHDESGLGLGLNFVQKVVDLAGGTVKLDSVDGAGTMIALRLPRLPPSRILNTIKAQSVFSR